MAQEKCGCSSVQCYKADNELGPVYYCDKEITKQFRIKLPEEYNRAFGVKLMTREEALKIVEKNDYSAPGAAARFVSALEDLGLIKFDEPKDKTPVQIIDHAFMCGNGSAGVLKELEKNGFKIVKMNEFAQVTMNESNFIQGKLTSIKQ